MTCNHGKLYAVISVEIYMPIEHNSASEISSARDQIENIMTYTIGEYAKYKIKNEVRVNNGT